MLEADSVSLTLGRARVLRDISMSVRAGEVLALCGPNGAGKSSLLSVLSGERRPQSGAVRLGGRALSAFSPLEIARRRAVLEQHPAIDLAFTVRELVLLGAACLQPSTSFNVAARALEAIDRAGVGHLAERHVNSLSGGERLRAHFARVLMQLVAGKAERGGEVLLLDEPTASLDLAHQVGLLRAVRQVAAEGVAVAVVLHDLSLAAAFADRVALLQAGHLLSIAPPVQAFTSERLSALYGVEIAVGLDPSGRPLVRPVFPIFNHQGDAECSSL